MYTVGLDVDTELILLLHYDYCRSYGIKIFSWLATLYGSYFKLNTPVLFVLGFLLSLL